jgi:hypothetical protein
MSVATSSLYINDNGMICCVDHGGSYLRSEYAHRPQQCCYGTPLDSWERVDVDFVEEWTEIVGLEPRCEICTISSVKAAP